LRFLYFDQVGSTQDVVKDFVQTAGRGRKGRDWVSPKGNLYASGLYPWTGTIAEKPLMSFVAANALADTLSEYNISLKKK